MSALPSLPPAAATALDSVKAGTLPVYAAGASRTAPAKTPAERAWDQAQDFEAVFLNSMMQEMFTGIGDEGPMGNSQATGMWRSFLIDEYARSTVKAGGIGIAREVYTTLLAQQEARSPTGTKPQTPGSVQ